MLNKPKLTVLVLGLNGSGKSTLIDKLKPVVCQKRTVEPTKGYEIVWVPYKRYYIKFLDMSGTSNYRSIWSSHTDNVQSLVFVIDSSDTMSFPSAREELHNILETPYLSKHRVPLLILANKNDLEESAPIEVISSELNVDSITSRPVLIKSVCSFYPQELFQAIDWLMFQNIKL